MEFSEFFQHALGEGKHPWPYQQQLANSDWPDILNVPTGMGKTAAVTLSWAYKRGWRMGGRAKERVDDNTPRRLVWCLPMRVLVEQTRDVIEGWLKQLDIWGDVGTGNVSVHTLMGGEPDLKSWAEHPEQDMILIGTQDMLLSRALMRGYGMSRYQWPIHFALLHNDCLWVFDEVQLMGAGLATSAQLEAFRRKDEFPLAKPSRSLWVSATLNQDWLKTVDMRAHSLSSATIGEDDKEQAGDRLQAVKKLEQASVSLTAGAGSKKASAKDNDDYPTKLRDLILEKHDPSAQTLVIVNRVDRAQELFKSLQKERKGKSDLLIHARFRAAEREGQAKALGDNSTDRIIVATQAIEAGVDISSKVLMTELAPWSSMVQRVGRCNRYGEYNQKGGATVFWVDIDTKDEKKAKDLYLPYSAEALDDARTQLQTLTSASPNDLPTDGSERPLSAVLRRKDLLDLFNTDPDLSGFDVDISDYIRDHDTPGVQVFWRDFKSDPNTSAAGKPEDKPGRDELCPISISQAKDIQKRKLGAWYWDTLGDHDKKRSRQWVKLTRVPRPGMTLLLAASDRGYYDTTGFDASLKKPVEVVDRGDKNLLPEDSFAGDWRSRQNKQVALVDHLGHVATQAKSLCDDLGETGYQTSVIRAARWHDLGKAHSVFQTTMYGGNAQTSDQPFLAKSSSTAKHSRPFFRHELASMLAWLAQHDGEEQADLIAYLILAHHGKVRTSLRAMPTEAYDPQKAEKTEGADGGKDKRDPRFARGIYEGDTLPTLEFDGEQSRETTLQLALMELGESEKQGRSWSERALNLLNEHGPFRLTWLETLVRLADWRASAAEQTEQENAT